MRRAGEGRVELGGVAIVIVERHVVRDVVVELRRAGLRGFPGIGHCGERLDVHLDGFGGVARLRQRFGHHKRHGVADIAHFFPTQREAVGLQQGRAIAALQRQAAGDRAVIGGRHVGGGPDPEHARHRLGGRCVDASDGAVRMAGTDDPGVGLPGQAEIVGIFALAANQGVIFLAADRLPDPILLQCNSVFERRRRRVILHENDLKCRFLRSFGGFPSDRPPVAERQRPIRYGPMPADRWARALLHARRALLKFP